MLPLCVQATRNREMMNRTLPFLLLAGLFAPLAPAQQTLADELPGQTALYFEIPDVQAFGQGFASSSMGRIWSDEAMQAFLEPVLPMISGGIASGKGQLSAMGMPPELLDLSAYGRLEVGFALGEISATGLDMVIGAHLQMKDPQVAAKVFGMLGGMLAGQGFEVGENALRLDDGIGTVDITLTGGSIKLMAKKGMTVTDHLVDNPRYVASRNTLGASHMFMFVDYEKLFGLMNSALAMSGEMELQMMVPMLMNGLGMNSLGSFGMSGGWTNGDSTSELAMTFAEGGPTGLVGVAMKGGPPADKSLAEYVPANATQFSIGSTNYAGMWNELTGMFDQLMAVAMPGAAEGDVQLPEPIKYFESKREEFGTAVAAIGPESFSWSKAEFSMTGGGGEGATFVRVRDVAAVRAMMGELMPMISQALEGVELVSLEVKNATDRQKDAEGNWTTVKIGEYYQVRFNLAALPLPPEVQMQMTMAASMLPQPAFGITDDGWMVMSMNGSSPVRKAMKSGVTKPAENILSNPEAADFLGRVPASSGMLAWSDPRPFVGGMITTAQGFLPMIAAQAGDEMPLDLDKMPGPDSFTKHLRTSESYAWYADGMMRQKAVGSMGAGELMVFALAGGAMFAGITTQQAMVQDEAQAYEEWEVVEEPVVGDHQHDGGDTTLAELMRLDTGLMLYSAVNGSYPASLSDLLQPQQDWEDGFLADRDLGIVADAWGNAFVYKKEGEGYTLYSVGPNGTDEGGAGDDLKLD